MAGDDDITVDLEGEGIDPRAVADAILAVERLVKSLDIEPHLTLTDLSTGSAHVSMSAGGQSLEALSGGLAQLGGAAELPDGWVRDTVLAVLGMGKVTKLRGVDSMDVRIGTAIAHIDAAMQANAESVLEPKSRTLGSVRGVLYRYINDKNNRSAGLRNLNDGEVVTLHFDTDTAPLIKENLDTEVEVWGEIARDVTDRIIHVMVEGIEPIPVSEPARASNGRGLLGEDWTNGIDPVEWVRMQRD
ncbi:hypothetical protein P3F83_07850 [Mycobacteroides immunogenum]|uniref:hypothetical protein n=1 Tax=Mycobacteroides immunogenum TaxID=83262 RepID=UPI0025B79AA0|nr:hypothetical protein [Mycobacteroides immunogenum]WJR35274.1 hypothetical protein P3F83_07850 [Mycobacteroides immunogenum]